MVISSCVSTAITAPWSRSAGYIADRIAVMHRGQIEEEGLAKVVLANPRHDYTRQLIAAVPGGLGLETSSTVQPVPVS